MPLPAATLGNAWKKWINIQVSTYSENSNNTKPGRIKKIIGCGSIPPGGMHRISDCKDGYTRKRCYQFKICRRKDVLYILEIILPYLIVKRKQAKLLLEFCKLRENKIAKNQEDKNLKHKNQYAPYSIEERKIFDEMAYLNAKNMETFTIKNFKKMWE